MKMETFLNSQGIPWEIFFEEENNEDMPPIDNYDPYDPY